MGYAVSFVKGSVMKSIECPRAGRGSGLHTTDKTAFVTLVMLDDGYIPGALLLGYALRKQNYRSLLICMVTEEITSPGRDLLRIIFDHVVEVEKVFVPCRRMKQSHYLPYVFTKLNTLLLSSGGLLSLDLQKVIFLDADVLPLKNYHALTSLVPPAGIINEYKSNLILNDKAGRYRIKDRSGSQGKWHWHNIYDPICPHGSAIPAYITDRVRANAGNMGIHGALLVLKPSVYEFDRIMMDLNRPETCDKILRYCWPEMQYLTLRWSGLWRNIDIRYCGLKGYPSMDLLYGTHFAGVKPWKILDGRSDLCQLPDHRVWYDLYLKMFDEYPEGFKGRGKYRKLARAIRMARKSSRARKVKEEKEVGQFDWRTGFR
jgi:glycogenin glucosyltransferase